MMNASFWKNAQPNQFVSWREILEWNRNNTDMNLKPLVEIKDAHIVGDRLYGVPVNHPSPYVSNTTVVRTSPIVKNDGENVETQNTMYKVLNWYDPTQPYRESVRPARDSHRAGDE